VRTDRRGRRLIILALAAFLVPAVGGWSFVCASHASTDLAVRSDTSNHTCPHVSAPGVTRLPPGVVTPQRPFDMSSPSGTRFAWSASGFLDGVRRARSVPSELRLLLRTVVFLL
jgi:hypothetical protein